MKKSTILLSLGAFALMVGCSKDDTPSGNTNQNDLDGAFVSVSISQIGSRAAMPDEPGSAEESSVAAVRLFAFDRNYDYIGFFDGAQSSGYPTKFEFEVAPDAYLFFALVNPTDGIKASLENITGNWNNVSSSLQTELALAYRSDLDQYKTDNAYVMVNAGSYAGGTETVLVRPDDSELNDGKLSIVPGDPTNIEIKVDRLVAKFSAKIGASFTVTDSRGSVSASGTPNVAGDPAGTGLYGKVEGVRLNVVNKKSYIYSHIKAMSSPDKDYRGDPNMSVVGEAAKPRGESTSLLDNFFWLHNYEDTAFNELANSTEYMFENTATGDYYNYNNLTQLVVKAVYRPTGQTELADGHNTALTHDPDDRNSWFAIKIAGHGTMQMTLAGVKQYYNALVDPSNPFGSSYNDQDIADRMDVQLQHMLAKAEDKGLISDITTAKWSDPNLTIEVLNSIPNGGYVAATVSDSKYYVVQFYQFGLNYYDIFIKHDYDNAGVGYMGRWGVVRNNNYTMSINSIKGPGLSYIPDPTDPDIKDPDNPDPKDPEKADKDMALVDATISVNHWTMWSQDVDLN